MLRKKFCMTLPESYTYTVVEDSKKLVALAYTTFGEEGHDIFVTDLFQDCELVGRYFADNATGEHKGWAKAENKWYQKIRLDNLAAVITKQPMCGQWWYYAADRYMFAEETNEVAYSYFGTNVGSWENDQEREIMKKRQRRHEELVDERVKNLLYPEPEGFLEWAKEKMVVKYALCEKDSVEKNVRCTCTCCGKSWVRNKYYRDSSEIECPECGEKIKPKRYASLQNGFGTEIIAYLIRPSKNGDSWLMGQYRVFGMFQNGKWSHDIYPEILADIPKGKSWGKLYYRNGSWNDKKPYMGFNFKNGLLYPDLGGAEPLMEEEVARNTKAVADAEIYCNINYVVITELPQLEYLVKGRFYKMAHEVLDGYGYYVDRKAKTLEGYFKLDKQRVSRLRKMDGGRCALSWLQREKKSGKKMSDEIIAWFAKRGVYSDGGTLRGDSWKELFKRFKSPVKAKNYVERQARESGLSISEVIFDYNDYINMAAKQGIDLSHEIFYKPKNLAAAHAECVAFGQKEEAKTRADEVRKKFPKVEEVLKTIKEKYAYSGKGFQIIVPETIEDIICEGRALGHCIDTSDRYFDRIQKRVTYLVFLRRTSAPAAAYYTLEIEPGGTVRQQRTVGNKQNKTQVKGYMPFIKEWQAAVQQRITEEDRKLAVESNKIRIIEYKKLRDDKELIHNGVLAGKLLVDVLESDLIIAG